MKWVECILLARVSIFVHILEPEMVADRLPQSYILYQERHVLSKNRAAADNSAGAGLARSGTRKKPTQTFVTLSSPKALGAAQNSPFEPGSLLAKRL